MSINLNENMDPAKDPGNETGWDRWVVAEAVDKVSASGNPVFELKAHRKSGEPGEVRHWISQTGAGWRNYGRPFVLALFADQDMPDELNEDILLRMEFDALTKLEVDDRGYHNLRFDGANVRNMTLREVDEDVPF